MHYSWEGKLIIEERRQGPRVLPVITQYDDNSLMFLLNLYGYLFSF